MLRKLFLIVFLLGISTKPFPCYSQEPVKLHVSSATKTLGFGPLWIASKRGFFARQGLDIDLVVIRGSDVGIQALAGGSTQIAGAAADAPVAAIEKGLDLVLVGGIINGLSQSLMAAEQYRTYDDLRGATIGAISLTSGTTFALKRVLQTKGLEYPRDYKLLVIGGSPQLYAALTTGQIAAAPLSLPLNYAAEEQGFHSVGQFIDVIPNYQLAALSVKRSWAEANRPILVRFMKAMAQTYRWIFANKEEAVDMLSKEMKLKLAWARKGWEFYTQKRLWDPDGDLNIEGLQIVAQIYAEESQAKGPVPNAAKYIDQSYLREALKEMPSR
jgi:ABC-type nitrate/sulfonate/bicarbonate transport system substrate-binding protein